MIALRQATLGYPGKAVLSGLDLTLPECGSVALMAPSGFGKTTLLRTLAGLTPLLSGQITGLSGRKTAFLFQEDRLLPWLTARQNAALAGSADAADAWLAKMEIEQPDQFPREMSGGMQRRVALARALTLGGDMLLLDEPFKGLDEALRGRIAARIRNAAPLIILSVHDEAEAALMHAAILRLDEITGGRNA